MRDLARVSSIGAQGGAPEVELTRFCTHCGTLHDASEATPERPLRGRVCSDCSLGVVLTCAAELLDRGGAAFLVVTSELRISAASEAAEGLLGAGDSLYARPLLSVITSPVGVPELARRVVRAAAGDRGVATLPVEPAAARLPDGVSLEAKIGWCGDPAAALVVVESAGSE
jgi:hypothetical protein